MPDVVIPSAERTGMILPLREWVLRQACQPLHQCQSAGIAVPSIAVNVSPGQVMGPAFAHTLECVLRDIGPIPARSAWNLARIHR
jgi:EAL domain-containing protein (putative c-di-GMP-specific phosphodiesterase class I)